VDQNPTSRVSHVCDIRGLPKDENGNWVEERAWLRVNQQEYYVTYQERIMNKAEYVENLCNKKGI
jgi:hypothetical protein